MLNKSILVYSNHLKYGVIHQGTIRDFIEEHSNSKYYYTPPENLPLVNVFGFTVRQEDVDAESWKKNRGWIYMLQKMDPERYVKNRLFVSKDEILRLNEEHEEFGMWYLSGDGFTPRWFLEYDDFVTSSFTGTPTFEQEFMWRAHMTDHKDYVNYCMKNFGRVVAHKT